MIERTIEERVVAVVVDKFGDDPPVTMKTRYEDLHLDSLDTVELVMDLEDEFGVEIEDRDFEKARTIKDLVEVVNQAVDSRTGKPRRRG